MSINLLTWSHCFPAALHLQWRTEFLCNGSSFCLGNSLAILVQTGGKLTRVCDLICCETDTSADVLQGTTCVPVSICPRSLECVVWGAQTSLSLCHVLFHCLQLWLVTAPRDSRDFFSWLTLNYSVNSSLEMTQWKFFILLLHVCQVASLWPKVSLEARLGFTRLLLSFRSQTFNLSDVFCKELYKLCSFVFCDMWLKNSSCCFLWMRLALVNPSDFWYLYLHSVLVCVMAARGNIFFIVWVEFAH